MKESLAPAPLDLSLPALGDEEFGQIQRLIGKLAGVNMAGSKKSLVSGRLLRRLRALECASYQEYVDLIQDPANEAERSVFVDLLTTHETHFFREAPHFDLIVRQALKCAQRPAPFRLWSAACSSGEEAFSAAMVLHNALGPGRYKIFATDVSDGTLALARKALYPLDSAGTIPQQHLKTFCERGAGRMEGTFRVKQALRDHIDFACMNLLEPWSIRGKFDIILLRNVMIYFDLKTKTVLAARLMSMLAPGGLLVIGHSETLTGLVPGLVRAEQTAYRVTA